MRLVRTAAFALSLATLAPAALARPPQKRPSAEQLDAFSSALAAGRKAAKAKDYKAAITSLEAALKVVPSSASVLGELGWALFQDGQLDKAEEITWKGIAASHRAPQLGALYYNRGRICEAKKATDDARRAYTTSLGFRENDTVRKRVESLGGTRSTSTAASVSDSFEAAATGAIDVYCEAPAPKAEGKEVPCAYSVTQDLTLGDGGLDTARVVHYEGYADGGGTVDADVLFLSHGGKWFDMGVIADGWLPGFGYVYNSGKVNSVEAKDVLPDAPGPELIVVTTNENTDHDPGVEMTSNEAKTSWRLCGLVSGKPTCVTVTSAYDYSTGELGEDWNVKKVLDEGKWTVDVGVTDGKVTLSAPKGVKAKSLPPASQACIGAFSVTELLGKACAESVVAE
jgi:hypothetical protein